jgi:flagellar basal-body rod modification protein FlgD
MTGSNPIVGQTPPDTSSSSSSSPSNQLDANSFITLLTTQLQAQDPLNPLDPNQMVDELTNMNSFEQLLQIRQDLDTLVGAAQGTGSGTSGSSGTGGTGTGSTAPSGGSSSNTTGAAPAANASQISALSNVLVSKSLGTLSTQWNSQPQLF